MANWSQAAAASGSVFLVQMTSRVYVASTTTAPAPPTQLGTPRDEAGDRPRAVSSATSSSVSFFISCCRLLFKAGSYRRDPGEWSHLK